MASRFGVTMDEHPWFWTLIGVDQALHHLTGFGLSIFMAANSAPRSGGKSAHRWRGADANCVPAVPIRLAAGKYPGSLLVGVVNLSLEDCTASSVQGEPAMFSSRDAFENDFCPVRDELLGEMYRANANGLPMLVESVSSEVRAMLALFCYRRSHLHALALAIAASCTERELIQLGGPRRFHALCAVARAVGHSAASSSTAAASRSRSRPSRSRPSSRSRTSRRRRSCRTRCNGVDSARSPHRYLHRHRQPVALSRHGAFNIARHAGAADFGPYRVDLHAVAIPILPDSAEQRSPSQRIPDNLSLTNFSGMRSSAASSSMVKRGQFDEYEQHAPQAWQGLSAFTAGSLFSKASSGKASSGMASSSAKWRSRPAGCGSYQASLGGSQTRLCRHFARRASRRSGYFSSRYTASTTRSVRKLRKSLRSSHHATTIRTASR